MKRNKNIQRLKEEENEFKEVHTKRIGQRKRSKLSRGENIIAEYLKDNQIEFYREFYFKDLFYQGKRKILFFDFYIPSYNLCIEFDGEQHYTGKFMGKKMPNLKKNDFIKSAFCRSTGKRLLRIKYDQIENIELIICKYFDEIN